MSEQKRKPPVQPAPMRGPRGMVMGPRQPINKDTVIRLFGYIKPYWPRLLVVLCCILLNAVATASAATFPVLSAIRHSVRSAVSARFHTAQTLTARFSLLGAA